MKQLLAAPSLRSDANKAPCAVMLTGSQTLQLSQSDFLCPDAESHLVPSWSCTDCPGAAAAWQAQVITHAACNTKHIHLRRCVNVCPGADRCSRFTTWSLGHAVLGSSGEGRSWTPHQLASCRQGSQHTPSQVDTDVQAACTESAGDQCLPAHPCQWPAQQTSETSHPHINTCATNKLH